MSLMSILENNPVIPVVSIDTLESAYLYFDKLREKNIQIIELTLRSKNALNVVEKLINHPDFNDFTIGVGTIISIDQMTACHEMGARFQVSPGFTPMLLEHAKINKINYLPGAITPHEVMTLQSFGFHCAKFFPAGAMNGLQVLKSYLSVFPGMKFCVTGGINEQNKPQYLALDNIIAIGSSSI